MNHSGTMRTPAFGVVPAGDAIVVTIEKPLADHEQPVVITQQPTQVRIAATYRTKIILQNDADQPIPYMMIIVPRQLIKLGRLPWKQLYDVLQHPQGRAALLDRAMRALRGVAAVATPRIKPGED